MLIIRGRTSTYRGSEVPLDSDRSSLSGMSARDRFTQDQSYSHFRQPMVSVSSKREDQLNLFRPSEDNPFADNISKYYRDQDRYCRNKNRDTSFSNFERIKEDEAALRFSKTMRHEFDSRQK